MKKRILLACAAGLSTSMFVQRMQDAAKKHNIDVEIQAFPTIKVREELHNACALLLGPQVRFELKTFQNLVGDKMLVQVIPPMDYGVMNGEKVLLEVWDQIK